MKLLAEEYLNAGKRVLFANANGSVLKRRKKHLTLIQVVK